MYSYSVRFMVNGMKTEQVVKANTGLDAENLIKAQYGSQNVIIIFVKKL